MSRKNVMVDVLVASILKGIDQLKGEQVRLLDFREIDNAMCDYFVVSSGTSSVHVQAISSLVQKFVRKEVKEKIHHMEGFSSADWILLDYVNVVVHIFQKSVRERYDIEHLWGDVPIKEIGL